MGTLGRSNYQQIHAKLGLQYVSSSPAPLGSELNLARDSDIAGSAKTRYFPKFAG